LNSVNLNRKILIKPMSTASFDILAATKYGYLSLWERRALVARLALIPILVKILSYFFILANGLDTNFLRQGLILFPSYLLEGYLICTLVRVCIFTHEPLIQPPGSAADAYYRQRGRDIQAGAVIYTLIKLISSLCAALIFMAAPPDAVAVQEANNGGSVAAFILFCVAVIFGIWAFRLLWLEVPVTLGYTVRDYLRRMRGYSFSFHLFSTWILCLLPLWLAANLINDLVMGIAGHTPETPSDSARYIMVAVQAFFETCIIAVSSIAIGKGIQDIMTGKNIINRNNR